MPTHYLYIKKQKYSPDSAAEIEGSSPWDSLFLFVRSLPLACSFYWTAIFRNSLVQQNGSNVQHAQSGVSKYECNSKFKVFRTKCTQRSLTNPKIHFWNKGNKSKKKIKIPYLIYGILNTLGNNSYFRRYSKPENYD